MPDQRRLVVMRHARTVTYAESDRARALTAEGRRDAAAAGAYLIRAGVTPDHALVSDAVRTRQTWEEVSRGLRFTGDLVLSDEVYRGSADTLVELVRGIPARARCAVLLGHNPAVAELVGHLDGGQGAPEVVAAVAGGFAPGAIALLELSGLSGPSGPWHDVGPGTARLVDVHVPTG